MKEHVRTLRRENPKACLEYIRDYTNSLERGFNALAKVLDRTGDDETSNLIHRIHRLRHATKFYPLLLKAWPNLDGDERQELLNAIDTDYCDSLPPAFRKPRVSSSVAPMFRRSAENNHSNPYETYIFRVYSIGNHRSHTGESSLYVRTRNINEDSPADIWVSKVVSLMNRYEDDQQFRRSLSGSDLYSKASSQDLRYLFYFYNEYRADEKGERGGPTLTEAMSNEYTVEHIWPQTPEELPIEDAGEYPSPEARYDAYVDRLGNLTLASRSWNSKWGNTEFETKRDEGYVESKLWVQWDIQDVYDEWSVENIEDRGETLTEFVLEKWATPETRLGGIKEPADAVSRLTEEERFVLKPLRQNTGGAVRRVIHGDVSDLPNSPFREPNSNGQERNKVGSILSRLQNVGLAERNKHTWSPTDEALAAEVPT